jgi:predicted PurR-regulated permease PerM
MRAPFPWLGVLVVLGVCGFAIHHLMPVLIPFALAAAAAYILNPIVATAEVHGMRRPVVVIAGYLFVAFAAAALAGTLIPMLGRELASLQEDLPGYAARLRLSWLGMHRSLLHKLPFLAPQLKGLDASLAFEKLIHQAEYLPSYLLSAAPILSLTFLLPFISFFLLMDGSTSIDRLIQRLPSRYVEQVLHLVSEIDHSLGAYLRGLVLVALALTAASFVGLKMLGVDQALWIAVLSGVSSFVPYLGAIVGMVVGGLAAGIQFGSFVAGLKVVLLFLVIRLADEIVLQPYIAKHSVHLHPLLFLFTFMTGGELFGFIGLLFAVPVACVVKALVDVAWSWYSSEARWVGAADLEVDVIPHT